MPSDQVSDKAASTNDPRIQSIVAHPRKGIRHLNLMSGKQTSQQMRIFSNLYLLVIILLATSCAQNQSENNIKETETETQTKTKKTVIPYRAEAVKKKTLKKTILWHKQSAAQGFAEAENSLGSLFQAIVGNTEYSKESIKSFKKAANQGHAGAQNSLAMRYLLGNGVRKDIPKALQWYEEAGKNGNIHAIHNLGRIYIKGHSVKPDNIQAYKWLDLARYYTLYSNNKRLKGSIRAEIDQLTSKMTEQQIADAKTQAQTWLDKLQTSKRYSVQQKKLKISSQS